MTSASWLIDLDNTLYPAQSNLFDQIDVRMGQFISEMFDVDRVEARRIQKDYFKRFGTTLSGLIECHGIQPDAFLDYVHDIDVTPIAQDKELVALMDALPGRKFIYTNGSYGHAERVIARLELEGHFEDIFDIKAADFKAKPALSAMERCVERFGVDPKGATMIDDMAKNLEPAAALGMHTVWIDTGSEWGELGHGAHVKETARDFKTWLSKTVS